MRRRYPGGPPPASGRRIVLFSLAVRETVRSNKSDTVRVTGDGSCHRAEAIMAEKKRVKAVRDDEDDRPARKRRDPLGKLVEEYRPSKAVLLMGALAAPILGAVAGVGGMLALDRDQWVGAMVTAAAFALVGLACVALLLFGRTNSMFAIHERGVRFQVRRNSTYLLWDEIEEIDIRRVHRIVGRTTKARYEVLLIGSETIHLKNWFLNALDDPNGLIKTLKRHSGKDFETAAFV
jgi:hypothetical protein